MPRAVKCQGCLELESDREKVIKNDKGRYFHIGECYDKHLEHRRLVEEENKKLDELYQYIKTLHGIPDEHFKHTMKSVMWRIQELRNGNDIFEGKKVERKYKIGIEYDLLLEAYKTQEDKIKWFLDNVLKNGMSSKDINACLSMALKGLSEAWRIQQAQKKREEEKSRSIAVTQEVKNYHSDNPITSRKKRDELDISDLL